MRNCRIDARAISFKIRIANIGYCETGRRVDSDITPPEPVRGGLVSELLVQPLHCRVHDGVAAIRDIVRPKPDWLVDWKFGVDQKIAGRADEPRVRFRHRGMPIGTEVELCSEKWLGGKANSH